MIKKLQEEAFVRISRFFRLRDPCAMNIILAESSGRPKRVILLIDTEQLIHVENYRW